MKTSTLHRLFSRFFAFLFVFTLIQFSPVFGQRGPINDAGNFVPDVVVLLASEFELKDGRLIRGKVVRTVPHTSYDVKLHTGEIITLLEEEIAFKQKVLTDIREIGTAQHFGLASPILSTTGLVFSFGLSHDFGPGRKYSILFDENIATLYNPILNTSEFWARSSLLFGYKRNRTNTWSQVFYGGLTRGFESIESIWTNNYLPGQNESRVSVNWMVTARVELPLKIAGKYQLAPHLTYSLPFTNRSNAMESYLLFGVALRLF
ncbi:MAG: hypothetical protein LAT76_09835 [Schleiferiaceae bacterium]|nr:hypothetical protein [Schleiferiaceae bacterium]